jgi:hypothetical protein
MYSTCLFCKTNLGANEAIEQFPVGRRLAFDAAKGRLWVVCRKCERWNLTPIEERWEAIEECERSFRSTKLRVSTDEIGLGKISEGLELVRIGKPLRPEFAAWRYGDQFGRRRRNNIVKLGAIAAAAIAIPTIGPLVGIPLGAVSWNFFYYARIGVNFYQRRRIVARIPSSDGNPLRVRQKDVKETVILPPTDRETWGLRVRYRAGKHPNVPVWKYDPVTDETEIHGETAMRAAAQLLPLLNDKGASGRLIGDAVELATVSDDPTASFERIARIAAKTPTWREYGRGAMLAQMSPEFRLALEMISHEESERRALEGELYLLEDAWKEAEEIAAISDNLFLPTEISEKLSELKREVK